MDNDMSRSVILGRTIKCITYEEAIEKGFQVIDVRSAAEFATGSIPDAVNIPIFDDLERSVVGTIYKQGGKEQAVEKGFAFVDKKMNSLLLDFAPYKHGRLAVLCARAGMRSLSIVNLLNQSGYDAYQIEGGYKKYRHSIIDILEGFQPRLIVVHGLTGSGKTRIINQLENSIDLEGLAQHKSSLFGGLGGEPSNQRNFESTLVQTISRLGREPYFIEGESRKIGRVFIPKPLAFAMKEALLVNVHCSLDKRIERIVEDYPIEGSHKQAQVTEILLSLKQKMGKAKVEKMCSLFKDGNLTELVRILLVEYYDKRYERSMTKYSYDLELSSENISMAAAQLTDFRSRATTNC